MHGFRLSAITRRSRRSSAGSSVLRLAIPAMSSRLAKASAKCGFLRPGLPRLFQANRQGNRSAVVWRRQANAGQRYQASKAHRRGTMKGYQMAKTSKFDAADYLKTPAAIAAYLTAAFETA